tara:strand:- start:914 stop:1207 length:294 start_codon:yes stop_codon:yes gene_type:complete
MRKYIYLNNGTSNVIISQIENIMSVGTTSSTELTLKLYQEATVANIDTITITHDANVGAHDMKVWILGVIQDLFSSNWKEVAPLQVPPREISSIVYS